MPETIAFAAAAIATSLSASAATTATAAALIPVAGAAGAAAASVAATSVITGLLSSVAIAALQVGIQALIAPSRSQNFDRGSTVREATFADPTRRRFFGVGEIKTGGALAFWQPAPDGSLWRVVVFDCQSTDSITQHFLNNEPVILDADGWVTEPAKWAGNIVRIIPRFGKSEGSEQPHRYWRVLDTAAGAVDYGAYAEVEIRTTAGGADIATSGTALAGSTGGSTSAADAFDGSASTYWRGADGSIAAGTASVGYDLGSGNDAIVRQVALTAPTAGDPDYTAVDVLIQGDEANGSTTFTDAGPDGRTITNSGCAWSTSVAIAGASSIRIDSGDYLAIGSLAGAVMAPGSGPWTAEIDFQADAVGTAQTLMSRATFASSNAGWRLDLRAAGNLLFGYTTDGVGANEVQTIWGAEGLISAGTVYRVAVVVESGSVTVYLNGVALGSPVALTGAVYESNATFFVGRLAGGASLNLFEGYVNRIRIADAARTITTATALFPEVEGVPEGAPASAFKVQFSDDGTNWWDAWAVTDAGSYTSGETKTFTRSGMQEAMPELIGAFDAWTYAHRGDDLSYVAIQQKPVALTALSETYPRGATGEEWTAIRRADDQVWDPRDDSYGYSDNPALCLLRVLMHPDGGRLTAADFDLDAWEAAADACDTSTTTPEGYTEARYRVAGLWEAAGVGGQQSLYSAVEQMLFAMNAMVYQDTTNSGKIGIVVDLPTANADGPLTSSDVLTIQISPAETYLDRYDATAVQWVSPAQGYADVVSPHYPFDLASPQRLRTLPGQMVPSHTQAARLAKLNHLRLSSPDAVTASLGPVGLLTREADRIAFDMIEAPEGLEIIVTEYDMGPSDSPSFAISGWGIPSGYGTFDPTTEIDEEILPPALTADGELVPAPTNLAAGIDKDDPTLLRIIYGQPPTPGLAIEYQWDIGQDGAFEGRVREFPATAGLAEVEVSVGAETLASVRARYIKITGGASAYTTIQDIPADGPLPAPTAPTISNSASPVGSGGTASGSVSVGFVESEGVYRLDIYAGPSGAPTFNRSVSLIGLSSPQTVSYSTPGTAGSVISVRVEVVNVSNNATTSSTLNFDILPGGGGEGGA